jgi:hypothetical protein
MSEFYNQQLNLLRCVALACIGVDMEPCATEAIAQQITELLGDLQQSAAAAGISMTHGSSDTPAWLACYGNTSTRNIVRAWWHENGCVAAECNTDGDIVYGPVAVAQLLVEKLSASAREPDCAQTQNDTGEFQALWNELWGKRPVPQALISATQGERFHVLAIMLDHRDKMHVVARNTDATAALLLGEIRDPQHYRTIWERWTPDLLRSVKCRGDMWEVIKGEG